MTKSPQKNVPDVGIKLGAACMPSEHASDRAAAPGHSKCDLDLMVMYWDGEGTTYNFGSVSIIMQKMNQIHQRLCKN